MVVVNENSRSAQALDAMPWRTIVCANWSVRGAGRAVAVADVRTRVVQWPLPQSWSLRALLALAEEPPKPVLVGIDVPIGVPAGYWDAVQPLLTHGASTFLDALPEILSWPEYLVPQRILDNWHLRRPFYALPGGAGSRSAWEKRLHSQGVTARRRVDVATGASPCFISSGIPGSVGSSAITLWKEVREALQSPRSWNLWPFELPGEITLAEIYPRAGYASALHDAPAGGRPRVRLAKTGRRVRELALDRLWRSAWVKKHEVSLPERTVAEDSEDAFDALMSVAGLLRSVLGDEPLASHHLVDPVAEGSIVGIGALDLTAREQEFNRTPRAPRPTKEMQPAGEPPNVPDDLRALRTALRAMAEGDETSARDALSPLRPRLEAATGRAAIPRERQLAMWRRDAWHCRYCGRPVVFPAALRLLTHTFPDLVPCHPNWQRSSTHPLYWDVYASYDHVLPLARGGTDEDDNLVTACSRCQYIKGDWLLEELRWDLRPIRPAGAWDGLSQAFVDAASGASWLTSAARQWLALLGAPNHAPRPDEGT